MKKVSIQYHIEHLKTKTTLPSIQKNCKTCND
jgi:hypothetical protein